MLIDRVPRSLLLLPPFEKWWLHSWSKNPPPDSADNGVGDYFAVGKEFAGYFKSWCELQPAHSILDVGCGSGRIALGLARELSTQGRYEGFDVRPAAIEWCQRQISPRYPNFQFQSVNVINHAYKPDGDMEAETFKFPYSDATFDLVVLTSVFTHMRPQDVRHYLAEIHRVLRPAGHCFITWFALSDETRLLTAEHRSTLGFHWQHGECWAADLQAVEIATGYEESWIRSTYSNAGFSLKQDIIRGWWPGRSRESHGNYQDFIIARRSD